MCSYSRHSRALRFIHLCFEIHGCLCCSGPTHIPTTMCVRSRCAAFNKFASTCFAFCVSCLYENAKNTFMRTDTFHIDSARTSVSFLIHGPNHWTLVCIRTPKVDVSSCVHSSITQLELFASLSQAAFCEIVVFPRIVCVLLYVVGAAVCNQVWGHIMNTFVGLCVWTSVLCMGIVTFSLIQVLGKRFGKHILFSHRSHL